MTGNENDRYVLAVGLFGEGKFTAALEMARDILDRCPAHDGALYVTGNCLFVLGRHGEAIDAFSRKVSHQPENLAGRLGLAAARLADKQQVAADERDAIYRLLEGKQLTPYETNVVALVDIQAGRYREAVARIDKIEHAQGQGSSLVRLKASALQAGGDAPAAIDGLERWCEAQPSDAAAFSQLAELLRNTGAYDASVAAAERAAALSPEDADIAYRLGLSLLTIDNRRGAEQAFRRALDLAPADPWGAAHDLAVLQGAVPAALAAPTVRAIFDEYATYYDTKMVGRLGYRGPAVIRDYLEEECGADHSGYWDILDLGCGTGLVGAAFGDRKRRLVGIDLSPLMLRRARERNIYDALHEGELVKTLTQLRDERYDLAVAGEVFIYFGDLGPLFAALRPLLRPGGYVVFNTNSAGDGEQDIVPRHAKSFAHSSSYLRRAATDHGFEVRRCEQHFVRYEKGQPLATLVTVLRRGEGGAA